MSQQPIQGAWLPNEERLLRRVGVLLSSSLDTPLAYQREVCMEGTPVCLKVPLANGVD